MLKRFKTYGGEVPGADTPDLGVVKAVQTVGEVDDGFNQVGLESTEFADDVAEGRFSYTVLIQLVSRPGILTKVPYMYGAVGTSVMSGAVPTPGQGVLVLYVGSMRSPVAIGGFNYWPVMRRLVRDGLLPELKPGEVLHQAGIRNDPMSLVAGAETSGQPGGQFYEVLKGGRVYHDYKGRLTIESRHFRADGTDGAFVQTVYGNPSLSKADDEAADFNETDTSAESLIALQTTVRSRPGDDPLFVLNITQDGKIALEFVKGWIGRAPGDGAEPPVTVEIDVANGQVILDAPEILQGRAATEKAVLGDTLVSMMGDLIDLITGMRQPVAGAGPTAGPPTNLGEFLSLKNQLSTMLSETNKVE